MMCSMCGKETKLYIASIEGTEMKVCGDCAKFGKILREVRVEPIHKKKKEIKQARKTEQYENEIMEMVVSDYANIIRNKREKMGLKQKDFAQMLKEKESRIHNIETGKFTPSLILAKKLEKILKVRLIEEYEEKNIRKSENDSKGFTLGDMIRTKK